MPVREVTNRGRVDENVQQLNERKSDDKGSASLSDEEKRSLERELSELRKEILESRNLVIKTDNLLKNIFAEVKLVSKRNDDQFKRTWFASATAYALFFGLSVTVAILAARASVSSERAKIESAQLAADQAKKRAEELSSQMARSRQESDLSRVAHEKAIAAYKLLTDGTGDSRLRGVDELAKLDRTRLNALEQRALDDRARSLKAELAQTAWERGRNAFARDDSKTALAELKRYLLLDPEGAEANAATFMLGAASLAQKDIEGAVAYLEKFISRGKNQKNIALAHALLGQAYEQQGHVDRAIEIYRRGISEYPNSDYVTMINQKLRTAQYNLKNSAAKPADPASPSVSTSTQALSPASPSVPPTPNAPSPQVPAQKR